MGRALRQAITPDRLLGRVVSSFRLIGVSTIPLGALAGGTLALLTDIRVTYVAAALVTGLVPIYTRRALDPGALRSALGPHADGSSGRHGATDG